MGYQSAGGARIGGFYRVVGVIVRLDTSATAMATSTRATASVLDVLLFVPNLIGYGRLALVGLAVWLHAAERPVGCLTAYCANAALDLVDGWAARKLGQTSKFGEILDVVVDNIGRGVIWALVAATTTHRALPAVCGLMATLESLTFAMAHASSLVAQKNWKLQQLGTDEVATSLEPPHPFVARIFANNFRNTLGTLAIGGTFFLPVHIYALDTIPQGYRAWLGDSDDALLLVGALVLLGRLIAVLAECSIIRRYLLFILQGDAAAHTRQTPAAGGRRKAKPAAQRQPSPAPPARRRSKSPAARRRR